MAAKPALHLTTARIETLGDGVFAIAMTLLILEIRVPRLDPKTASADLPGALFAMWPQFLCYLISFVTLGVYWVAHHLHFYTIERADRMLMWINILFLMAIGFVPFSTALIAAYVHERIPAVLYGANMVVASLILQWQWWYATRQHRLVSADLNPALVRSVTQVILTGPVVYLIAMALAFVNPAISIALYLLVNLLYIVPGGIHLHFRRHTVPAASALR